MIGYNVDRSTPSGTDIRNYLAYTSTVSHLVVVVWRFIQRRENLNCPHFTHSTDICNFKIGKYDLKGLFFPILVWLKYTKYHADFPLLGYNPVLSGRSTSTHQKKWLPLLARVYLPWWWRQQIPSKRPIYYHNTWRHFPEESSRHCHINLRSHEQCYIWQDYVHKVPVILYDNLQRESHTPHAPPTTVTWLQLLRKQTNTGTTTALTAETRWAARTRLRALSRIVAWS